MKKSDNPIDQIFRDYFHGAQAPTDADSLWSSVSGQLPRKKRNYTILLGLVVLMLSIIIFGMWLKHTNNTSMPLTKINPSNVSTQLQEKKQVTPLKAEEPKRSVLLANSSELAQKVKLSAPYNSNTAINSLPKKQQVISEDFMTPATKDGVVILPINKSVAFEAINIATLPSLPPTPMESLTQNTESLLDVMVLPDPDWSRRCGEPGFWASHLIFDAYVFGGYPLISNSLNTNQDADYTDYLSMWNEGETAISTFSGGIMIGLQTKGGLSINTGVEYQRIQNRLNRNQTVTERVTVFDEMAYFFLDENNNRVYVADSVTTTRTYSRTLQAAKTHTLINLPLLLGYHNQFGKIRYGLIAGVNIHLQNEFKGKVLTSSNLIVDANSNTPSEVYRTQMNVSIIGGLDFGYMLNSNTELYLSPRFRFQPDSWLNSDHPILSKMQLIGLQTGVRLHLSY